MPEFHRLCQRAISSETCCLSPPLPGHSRVLCPEWLEVNREADLAPAVHFGGLAVQLGQLYFGRRGGVGGGDLKLPVKFVFDQVVDVPAHNGEG